MRVEIQDAGGKPLPGFALSDADHVIGDEISRVVTWGGKSDVRKLAGSTVRLRLVMLDADLYSLHFE